MIKNRKQKTQELDAELNTVVLSEDLLLLSVSKNYNLGIDSKYSPETLHLLERYARKSPEYLRKVNKKVINSYPRMKELFLEQYYHTQEKLNVRVEFNDQEKVSLVKRKDVKNNVITVQLILESIVHGIAEKLSQYTTDVVTPPKNSVLMNAKLPILLYQIVSFDYKLKQNCLIIKNIKLKTSKEVYNKEIEYSFDNIDGCKLVADNAEGMQKMGML
tara:strand:- start:3441 stop:4091 length:651 start_codon:yes stop_codon:yes gene_type:complete